MNVMNILNRLPNKKETLVLTVIVILAALLLFVSQCSRTKQEVATNNDQIAQNRIEALQDNIALLEKREIAYVAAQDSMSRINAALNRLIAQKDAKYAHIASIAAEEKNRVRELPDDSAAGLFLDRADCSEFPVLAYDSNYIIPIEPIRFYNLMAVDFDELKAIHHNLQDQYSIRVLQVRNLNGIIDKQSQRIDNLSEAINEKDGIIIQKDKQIVSGKKLLKQQKIKTFTAGAAGILLCAAGILL